MVFAPRGDDDGYVDDLTITDNKAIEVLQLTTVLPKNVDMWGRIRA